ncbi:hypothetical protein TTHERM_00912130 (macronuclear) [Tetrahymena thermophila SB210]|uniref:Zinc finger protein n=1 Tax=Tetrahymena thermophila (strain SB210) TaxID=312017 RepID=Q23TV8_TETTS|nr:hypothetical protein TTHERM_00912130 [Tetrahymena thermophila SB210]EAR99937.2 hypothetical protein TTHERM_00912130 [Tetrahymena thermophila SB210]|eukprot:XP_001020182.2 hypothetical protein TTHERM_00912130 [Tetrahymena thermophila SB210]
MSSQDSSTCQQSCQKGEINDENQQCVKCQVPGCVKCDIHQICLQCDVNLTLNSAQNQCQLQQNICQNNMSYILAPYSQDQCVISCPPSYYQNETTKICEKTIQCIQANDYFMPYSDKRIKQIEQINKNQYLVRATHCTFLLMDNNLNIISVQILQNMPNFYSEYMFFGEEMLQKSFIVGSFGGCTADNSLVVFDFETMNVVFNQTNLAYDQNVQYIDQANQIVFLGFNEIYDIFWYDALNYNLNKQTLPYNFLIKFIQIEKKTKTNYIIQIDFVNSMIMELQEDRSLAILNKTLNYSSISSLQVQQKQDFLIQIGQIHGLAQVQKIQFDNDFNLQIQSVELLNNSYSRIVYYSKNSYPK